MPLKIALIASEAVPWCKSGGLADVVGALPRALRDAAAAAEDAVEVADRRADLESACENCPTQALSIEE